MFERERDWNLAAIEAFNTEQAREDLHPLTCPNRGDAAHDAYHRVRDTRDVGVLVGSELGPMCPVCRYHLFITPRRAHMDVMLKLLGDLWRLFPEQRLGQLIANVLRNERGEVDIERVGKIEDEALFRELAERVRGKRL